MLRQGPVSAFIHGVLEYAAAVVFIAAPFVFSFDSDAATAVSIVAGVVVLAITASSDLPTGLAKAVPAPMHAVLDFILAAVLIAAPFLFGFSVEGTPTAFFIVVGVVHLLVTIATRFLPARASAT